MGVQRYGNKVHGNGNNVNGSTHTTGKKNLRIIIIIIDNNNNINNRNSRPKKKARETMRAPPSSSCYTSSLSPSSLSAR